MKKICIFLCVLLICFSCEEAEMKPVNIPGTRILILPPPGFVPGKDYSGFKRDGNTGIEASEYAESFYKYSENYSTEQLQAKGAIVYGNEEVKIDGYDARLITIKFDQTIKAYCVIFGDESFYVTLFGTYYFSDKATGDQIKTSLLNTKIDRTKEVSTNAEVAIFQLNDASSIFKLARSASNVFIYSLNGEAKSNYGLEPHLIAHQLPTDKKNTPQSIMDIVIDDLKIMKYENIVVKVTKDTLINGYPACENEIRCTYSDYTIELYNLVVIKNNKAVTIQARAFDNYEKNMEAFKKLARTVEFTK